MMRYGGESHDAARARPCPAAVTLPCREAAQIPARSVTHREDRGPAFEMGAWRCSEISLYPQTAMDRKTLFGVYSMRWRIFALVDRAWLR